MTMADQELLRTPTLDSLPRIHSDFATITAALEYAALGLRGFNFHDARGNLAKVYSYKNLCQDAQIIAAKLIKSGIKKGDRIALIAETSPQFAASFYGAIYAGAWPVPLPLPTSFSVKNNYVEQLSVQLDSCRPLMLCYPQELTELAKQAADKCKIKGLDWEQLSALPADEIDQVKLPQLQTDDIAYLQYSSGSTRFPHGVKVTHYQLLQNLAAHAHGMDFRPDDRAISWLPLYHDMGLVGCFLSPVANQVSVDYLKTDDFARRPLAWLDIISKNPHYSLSYSPTFGYDICARRVSLQTKVAERFDLSRWRLAGNGADMIRPDVMQSFVDVFHVAGFNSKAFMPSYGLAEATLAVTLMPPGEGIIVELVEESELSGADIIANRPQRYRSIVNCGKAVKGMKVEIRDDNGQVLPDKIIGKVWCSGTSLMEGYYQDEEATAACMVGDWLDTGDMGYLSEDYLYIVGRAKDMIIINGINHWPQDIEWAVEQLGKVKPGDVVAFAIVGKAGEEIPVILAQCRTLDLAEQAKLHQEIRERVQIVTGLNAIIELIPPRTIPLTSSGKISRAKSRDQYLSREIKPYSFSPAH